jgi:TadE-like protein/PKD domain
MLRARTRAARNAKRATSRHRGQALSEFAITLPVLFLVLLGALDFGRVFYGWVELNNMARIGANYAALHPDAWMPPAGPQPADYAEQIRADAAAAGCTLVGPTVPDPTFPDPAPETYSLGSRAQVTLSCQFGLLTGSIPVIGWALPNPLTLTATAVYPIRFGSLEGIPLQPPPTPTPTPQPTPTPAPTPTPTSGSSPTPTPPPGVASFYGTPLEAGYDPKKQVGPHSEGGGLGSNQIIVAWNSAVQIGWTNTSTGTVVTCAWDFGSGSSPQTDTNCSPSNTTYYQHKGTYTVTLTVNGASTAQYTVISECQVPDFSGISLTDNSRIDTVWQTAGYAGSVEDGTITVLSGKGNKTSIGKQSPNGGSLTACNINLSVGP